MAGTQNWNQLRLFSGKKVSAKYPVANIILLTKKLGGEYVMFFFLYKSLSVAIQHS